MDKKKVTYSQIRNRTAKIGTFAPNFLLSVFIGTFTTTPKIFATFKPLAFNLVYMQAEGVREAFSWERQFKKMTYQ